jgi:hypothetical protein
MLHIGCGSVGFIFACAIIATPQHAATAHPKSAFFIITSFIEVRSVRL